MKDLDAADLVMRYFRVKSSQMKAMAELPVCEHSGLAGSHREELQRVFLQEVLPRRFAVGRGMVYGPGHRSREADIVIWDADNYPSLPMLDHAFFFADSVRMVLECKSRWSKEEFRDVLGKAKAVRDIMTIREPTSTNDRLSLLEGQVEAMRTGSDFSGQLIVRHRIATAAIFLRGGESFGPDIVTDELQVDADDCWPDLVLMLESGLLAIKSYDCDNDEPVSGSVRFYNMGEDALAVFTAEMLQRLSERVVQVEDSFYLGRYLRLGDRDGPTAEVPFPLTRPAAMRRPIDW